MKTRSHGNQVMIRPHSGSWLFSFRASAASTPRNSRRTDHRPVTIQPRFQMLPASALQSMNVLLATPCYISAVSMNYVTSMFLLTHETVRLGLASSLHMRAESLVTRARNEIVKFFLMNEQYTHLFWIDSDIEFQPQAAIRLLLSDHDVAAGIYPIKRFNWPPQGVPAGTTREAFETLYTDYPINLIGHGDMPLASFVTEDDFVEVAEA